MRGPRPRHHERTLRRQQTDAERALWQYVRDRRLLDRKFRRQHAIGRFVADFVCLEARLIVEVDGSQHLDRAAYDDARTRWLETQGFRVIRFRNDDVLLRMDDVLTAIVAALAAPHPPCGHPRPASGERDDAE
ncbi:MAG: endonuclease domain-containing protein [Lysobacteraceae bacterium]